MRGLFFRCGAAWALTAVIAITSSARNGSSAQPTEPERTTKTTADQLQADAAFASRWLCVAQRAPSGARASSRYGSARASLAALLKQLPADLRSSIPVTTEDKNYSRLQKLKSSALAHQAASARMAFHDAVASLSSEEVAKAIESGCTADLAEVACESPDIITCVAKARGPYEGIVGAAWRMLAKLPPAEQQSAVDALAPALTLTWPPATPTLARSADSDRPER